LRVPGVHTPRGVEQQGLVIERNLSVPLREGTRIYLDSRCIRTFWCR
jgi:hypothetical protein